MASKMYNNKIIGFTILTLFILNSNIWAADYSTMSMQELSELRGTMQNASQADRKAFQSEWLSRVKQMTPAERENYMGPGKEMGDTDRSGQTGSMMGGGWPDGQ
ncbi:hypothetical protein [Desulfopila aestuarii]|uniref:DUF1104 domain-containing protein n=1 Tax=Desulfopila aestuarii DSM 18488 TaxID=1121416 RepID=A0A1M7YJL6_9BACT|nr:hypothetical protein [Desulfopila aestuarii]SHO52802.1 hypothetical protein SAMN02745220_04774 [Desulfopila aestuarii DSM 18488]